MTRNRIVRHLLGPLLGAGGGYLLHYLATCRGGG